MYRNGIFLMMKGYCKYEIIWKCWKLLLKITHNIRVENQKYDEKLILNIIYIYKYICIYKYFYDIDLQ